MNASHRKYFLLLLLFLSLATCAWAAGEKKSFTLVIDAGHGGRDAGAVGAFSKEKDINLNVALAFGRLVEENCPDVKVVYTRRTDVFIPLQRRADIANDNKADLFISVHTNALPGGRVAYGSETYTLGIARAAANLSVAKRENSVITLESDYQRTYQGFDPQKAESYVIFEIMQDKYMKQSVELAQCIQRQYKGAGRADKGVHQAGFLVLRNTSMPSVLTELGFITTPAEEKYLNSRRGITELSRSIYNGFLAYRRLYDKSAHALPANLPNQVTDDAPNLSVNPPDTAKKMEVVPVETTPTPRQVAQVKEEADTPRPQRTPAKEDAQAAAKQAQAAPEKETRKEQPRNNRTANAQNTKTKQKQPSPKQQAAKSTVSYRVQVGAGKTARQTNDPQFKGLKITREKEGSMYKYYYGTYSTYAEAQQALRKAKEKLSGAYLVAFVAGQPVSVAEARAKEKKRK